MNLAKKYGKSLTSLILEKQVKKLRLRYNFKVVAVVGSVGKTSTKLAVANTLSKDRKVRFQVGNYNDRLTVPLVFFGHVNPGVFNVLAWLKIFWSNHRQISNDYDYDVVVLELGTDAPGQIEKFSYIYPDIAVVTAVTPEHMEFFDSLDDVAQEELAVCEYSRIKIINGDDVEKKYLKNIDCKTYGLDKKHDFKGTIKPSKNGQKIHVDGVDAEIKLLGKQGAKVALAAYSVAKELDMSEANIKSALESLTAFSGRMNLLSGIKNSTIIDDTYNASPNAVTAGIDVLYDMKAPQKIAILGTMNELGQFSEEMHRQIGQYCDSSQLDLVVTIGEQAEKFIGQEALKKGCKVKSFVSPFEAGEFVAEEVKESALIFAKGSQNRVFAEESLKFLLKEDKDFDKLVRQSDFWLNEKYKQFGRRVG